MAKQRTRRDLLASAGASIAILSGCVGGGNNNSNTNTTSSTNGNNNETTTTTNAGSETGTKTQKSISGSMTVFHAGSLEPPFSNAEKPFEQKYSIDLDREAKGSVGSTKKIAEQGRKADILGVSDFRLIRDMMMPKFANWYGVFATNAMTIVYTKNSKYADEFGPKTWWDILSRDDVNVAHSDPAVDPNGYRSVMAMKLGAKKLEGSRLYNQSTAEALQQNAEVGAGTETELLAQVQTGALDYAWEYQSAGATHNVQTVDLQPHVDLSKATQKYANHYAKASVSAGGTTYTGAPIAYGITVPSVAKNPEAGAAWVEYFATKPGRKILKESGFNPVKTLMVPSAAESEVPKRVMGNAKAQASLGPLKLNPSDTSSQSLAPIQPSVKTSY